MKKRTWLDIILFSMLIISITFVAFRIFLYFHSTFTYLNDYFWNNSYGEEMKKNITPIIISNLLFALGNIFVLICLILTLCIKSNVSQNIKVILKARIELAKENIKTKRTVRFAKKNAKQKAKLQEKLDKLKSEENE